MTVSINGTSGIVNDATDLNYTGTLTGGTGVVNLGSGQVYKDASGNVGIGTSSPATKLDVLGEVSVAYSATYGIRFYNQDRNNWSSIGCNVATGTTTANLVFQDSTGEVARITGGNLLVGTTSTANAAKVEVNFNGSAANGIVLQTTRAATGSVYALFLNSAGATAGQISQNGTTTVAYTTSSDYRLKEAVQPMTGALAKVSALKPVIYKWKSDGSDSQGFIAHELQEVVPDCVVGEKDAVDADGNPQYQGIDTSFLVATLAAAIQELHELAKTQATRITALEGTAA